VCTSNVLWSNLTLFNVRNAVVNQLYELAQSFDDVLLMTGDLGYGVLTRFVESFPQRFINAGISEQNMTSVAAGMALEGKKVFTYSIANFPTLRCLEQIRNDCAYHHANVKIIAVGGGFAYGALGMSHHATEDIAIMRALPGVVVFAPGDLTEAEAVVNLAYEHEGVCYLRVGKGGERRIHPQSTKITMGRAIEIKAGKDIALFSTGSILDEVVSAVELLEGYGIHPYLFSFPTVKPIDETLIRQIANEVNLVVTIEEHNILGGFGSAVAEVLAETRDRNRARLLRIGLTDTYSSEIGTQGYLRDFYGLSAQKIFNQVKQSL
jgi:transketolase